MMYIVKEGTEKALWSCDAWDAECMNKANDWMTYNGYYAVKNEVTFSGNMIIWVKRI